MACIPTCIGRRPTFIAMMFMTSSFFLVEIVVGYVTNSMALVADSFHMLSDIISLVVGYFALKYSRKTNATILVANTFGFVRAEVLGALINAVFLIALCFSITVEALKRLFETEELKDPILILCVGAAGLFINLIGMFLFHGHTGHGHSHGGGGHGHSHSHGGHSHDSNDENHGHSHNKNKKKKKTSMEEESTTIVASNHHNKTHTPHSDCDTVEGARTVAIATCKQIENDITIEMYMETSCDTSTSALPAPDGVASTKQKNKTAGQMNMRGVYLHILGDALGSVIVIIAALIIYFFDGEWTLYVDPVLSLVLVLIILKTTIPLLKESSLILLQNVPSHIQLKSLQERLLEGFPEILAIHDFHVWQLTGSKIVASLHVKFLANANYKSLSASLKEFFHDEGIHSTTVQPEFVEEGSDDERECLLRCVSKACEEKLCCASPNKEFVDIINNDQAEELPKEMSKDDEKTSPKRRLSVELLKVTILNDNVQDDV